MIHQKIRVLLVPCCMLPLLLLLLLLMSYYCRHNYNQVVCIQHRYHHYYQTIRTHYHCQIEDNYWMMHHIYLFHSHYWTICIHSSHQIVDNNLDNKILDYYHYYNYHYYNRVLCLDPLLWMIRILLQFHEYNQI